MLIDEAEERTRELEEKMASLSLNSIVPPSPSQSRRIISEVSPSRGNFRPIVVSGKPPTFVSAPGRRIVAGKYELAIILYLSKKSPKPKKKQNIY